MKFTVDEGNNTNKISYLLVVCNLKEHSLYITMLLNILVIHSFNDIQIPGKRQLEKITKYQVAPGIFETIFLSTIHKKVNIK